MSAPDNSKRKLIQSTLSEEAGAGEFQTPEVGHDEIKTEEKIGGGCFGNVYKGYCRGKQVAIKKLHQQEMDDNLLDEFRKEVAIMTHLRHPNIVLFMGACTASGHLAIVTELMPRGSLHDVLHDPKVDLPLTMKLKFARDIALAMNWLHCSHPPIIHRDLKPTNVLVDENWNLKVCDFGLSAIKRQEKLQDNGVAPGTPLWMSPEVLRGRPLNEKADVYSYGIVLWEILTRKEPFENHDSYNSFVHAICDEKERPPIPADIHPSLKRLMELCWHEDPEKRPLFTEVLELLDDATIRSVLEEDDAQNLWRKFAKGKDKIPFTQFSRGLYATLGYGTPDELSTPYQCLKLLVAQKSQRDHEESVSLEMFSLFLRWFGGLRARSGAGASQGNILDRVKTLCEQEWFHGNISREESEQKLANEKKGTYLIRLSLTEPEKTPYTISKVNQKGIINHQRVSVNPGGAGYYVTIKYPDKPKKFEAAGPIGNLVKLVSKELSLKYPCAGSMFSSLFQKQEKFGGYLQDDD